jgi:hypothetical protein
MDPTHAIADAVTNIVKLMVDKPEDVSVEVVPMPDGMVLRYSVAPGDIGKLIGAQGRHARSLRVIVAAIGKGAKLRISLDLPGGSADLSGPDQG